MGIQGAPWRGKEPLLRHSCRRSWCLTAVEMTGLQAERKTDTETAAAVESAGAKLAEVAAKACTAWTDAADWKLVSKAVCVGSRPEAAAQQSLGTSFESQGTLLRHGCFLKRGCCSAGRFRSCSCQSETGWGWRELSWALLESKRLESAAVQRWR